MAVSMMPTPAVAPIRVPALAWAAVLVAIAWTYLMLQENGTILSHGWEHLHELFHDGRHALGVPCH